MYHWTPRVSRRAELARMLKTRFPDRARKAGMTTADVDTVIDTGERAQAADREQKAQIASIATEREGRKLTAEEVFASEDRLRARLPAVIEDLLAGDTRELGRWLKHLTFERYRMRELTPQPGEPAATPGSPEEALLRKVRRVEREDIPTRLDGLAAFCAALRAEDRKAIVERLAERQFDDAALEALGGDAETLARLGRNVWRAAEATGREAEAAKAQGARWHAIRRMVRDAVQGQPELTSKFAEC